MAGARRFWGGLDPKKAQIVFGAVNEQNISCADILVLMDNRWFNAKLEGESGSLIEALKRRSSFNPPWEAFQHYEVTLEQCFKDNPAVTLQEMRECCAREIERTCHTKSYVTTDRINGWKLFLKELGGDLPAELASLIQDTIVQLVAVWVKQPVPSRKNYKSPSGIAPGSF